MYTYVFTVSRVAENYFVDMRSVSTPCEGINKANLGSYSTLITNKVDSTTKIDMFI